MQEERYEHQGIVYVITVEEEAGLFWGHWHCTRCDQGYNVGHSSPTYDRAITDAKTHLQLHHVQAHKGKENT